MRGTVEKKKQGPLSESFRCAARGVWETLRRERNMKIHLAAAAAVTALGFALGISRAEWLVCLVLFGLVFACELLNTALENAVDLASPQRSETARHAKDAAAGAVLVAAVFAAAAGAVIFLPRLLALLR